MPQPDSNEQSISERVIGYQYEISNIELTPRTSEPVILDEIQGTYSLLSENRPTPTRKNELPPFDSNGIEQSLFVKHFGFEIEGGFSHEIGGLNEECECEDVEQYGCSCDDHEYNHSYFKEDGSVRSDHEICGEIASPKFRVDRMEQFELFTKNCMPVDANYSAGIHVHLSFNNNLAYAKCMDTDFYEQFRNKVFTELNNREKYSDETIVMFNNRYHDRPQHGQTNYCASQFCPDSQMDLYQWRTLQPCDHDRYTQMNYQSFDSHHTIECRLFPTTTDRNELISMVKWFINFTNSYLAKQSRYERGNYETVKLKNQTEETQIEELTLCV